MPPQQKIAFVAPECVACGSCAKVCPTGAISVPDGIRAKVNPIKCVGCAKCAKACPADVITLLVKEKSYG